MDLDKGLSYGIVFAEHWYRPIALALSLLKVHHERKERAEIRQRLKSLEERVETHVIPVHRTERTYKTERTEKRRVSTKGKIIGTLAGIVLSIPLLLIPERGAMPGHRPSDLYRYLTESLLSTLEQIVITETLTVPDLFHNEGYTTSSTIEMRLNYSRITTAAITSADIVVKYDGNNISLAQLKRYHPYDYIIFSALKRLQETGKVPLAAKVFALEEKTGVQDVVPFALLKVYTGGRTEVYFADPMKTYNNAQQLELNVTSEVATIDDLVTINDFKKKADSLPSEMRSSAYRAVKLYTDKMKDFAEPFTK